MASRLLSGLALGVLVGMLIAPDKGSETRKKISQKGNDLKHKFDDFVDSIRHKAEGVKDDVKSAAERTAKKARAMGNEMGNTWNG